jgi:hypothetical protein
VVNDLLWLTHEGYVIEFADGRLESVPPPKNPPKPEAAVEQVVTESSEADAPKEEILPATDTEEAAGSAG